MVAAALADWAAEELTDDATLLVSELATNAVLHAGTDFEVTAQLLGDSVEDRARGSELDGLHVEPRQVVDVHEGP